MKNLLLLLSLVLSSQTLKAQICYDLSSSPQLLTISLIAENDYTTPPSNFFSSTNVTLAWDQSLGSDVIQSIEAPSPFPFTYDPVGSPNPVLSGGQYYQKFGFTQNVVTNLLANQPVVVLEITVMSTSEASGSFSIVPSPPDEVVNGAASISNAFGEQYNNHGCNLTVNNVVLPLDFLSFIALPCNQSSCLTWETANEDGVDYFNVLRLNGTQWEKLGEKKATNEPTAIYRFIDGKVLAGQTYFYQIIGVDYDGAETHSEKRSVTFDRKTSVQVYPNPANDRVTVTSPEDVIIRVYDGQGSIQLELTNVEKPQTEINCSTWPAGSYTVTVYDNTGQLIDKVQFLKQ